MSEELKACPFCEGGAELNDDEEYYTFGCENSKCIAYCLKFTYWFDDLDEVQKKWNIRPIEDASIPESIFVNRISHILLDEGLTNDMKIHLIKLRYRIMAFPEVEVTETEQSALDFVYRRQNAPTES
ncbi:MAG TPA: Lar family restriction alleviation protein [Candidatus Nitrosopolaris rasttigaisensis]|nr:Lar family restriction alleviation protein [Candidatus Nitrosopolaris rasttigaisensis]